MEWSQPVGGATVIGYIIHYTDNDGNIETETANAGSTSVDITGLIVGVMYTITVEARSQHLSGESEPMIFTPGKSIPHYGIHHNIFPPLTESPPDTPMNVMADNVGTTSVSVSWDAVDDADRYTVTFTRATGDEQQGACTGSTHTATVTVDDPSTTASINIGENVVSSVTNMLRAYSTYFITVVASNDGGNSEDSEQISILTSQIGMRLMFHVVTPHFIYYLSVCMCMCTGAAIPPANVRVSVINSTSILVQWDIVSPCSAMNGLITSYSIRYTIQPNGIPQTTPQSDGLEITLTELTPFTEYSIEVAAVNENDDVGVYSEPEVVMTPIARMLILYQSFIP